MILSDRSINEAIASGRLGIDPFDPKLVQPSSIDVRLDDKFLVFRNTKRAYIDVKQPADDLMEMIEVGPDEPMFLHPHEFVLGSTIERVRMPDSTAGFIDASFEGHVTLEISNLANLPIALYPGMRIGQISFSLMTTPAERPYGAARGSKYSGQQLPTASRLYLDFR